MVSLFVAPYCFTPAHSPANRDRVTCSYCFYDPMRASTSLAPGAWCTLRSVNRFWQRNTGDDQHPECRCCFQFFSCTSLSLDGVLKRGPRAGGVLCLYPFRRFYLWRAVLISAL